MRLPVAQLLAAVVACSTVVAVVCCSVAFSAFSFSSCFQVHRSNSHSRTRSLSSNLLMMT